ncbi:response regulator transcription factor [Pseudonocardia sp. GCM10023141]|uniref:response regulator transcription factor n=1 Tax=Pseudonocardia sp. GCM10023141 TaxID=3252653 RepID=UPI0036183B0B
MSSVLVVDDESRIRDLLRRALQAEGYQVQTVATGAAALAAAADHPPDLVVLDLYLPDMHGLDVLGFLLAADPDLIVLIVSAASDISPVDALENGAQDFLPKPFALAELLARVRSGLRSLPPVSLAGSLDHPVMESAGTVVTPWRRQRSLELVGYALDRLRDTSGIAVVDAAIDQADAAIADTEPGHLTDALRDLLVEIRHCQRAGQMSSPALEARFRTAAAALARPDS